MTHTSFHFDLGNTTTGPVGYCARICALSPADAVARLLAILPTEIEVGRYLRTTDVHGGTDLRRELESESEYVTVYFAPDRPNESDIDEDEPCSCDSLTEGAAA